MEEIMENINPLVMNNTMEENIYHYLLNLKDENNLLNAQDMLDYFIELYSDRQKTDIGMLNFHDEFKETLAFVLNEDCVTGLNDNNTFILKLASSATSANFNVKFFKYLLEIKYCVVNKHKVQELQTKRAIENGALENVSYKYVGRNKRIVYVKSDTDLKTLQNYISKNDLSKEYDYICKYVENPNDLVTDNYKYIGINSLKFALMFRSENLNKSYSGLNVYFPTTKVDFLAKTGKEVKTRNSLINLLAAGNSNEEALFTAKYTNLPKPSYQEKQKLVSEFAENKKKKEENISEIIIDVCKNSEIQNIIQKVNNKNVPTK